LDLATRLLDQKKKIYFTHLAICRGILISSIIPATLDGKSEFYFHLSIIVALFYFGDGD
jgi:hypothetical protein